MIIAQPDGVVNDSKSEMVCTSRWLLVWLRHRLESLVTHHWMLPRKQNSDQFLGISGQTDAALFDGLVGVFAAKDKLCDFLAAFDGVLCPCWLDDGDAPSCD